MKQRVIVCALGPVLVTAMTTQYPEAFRAQTPVLEAILSIVDGRYLASQASVRPSYETEVRTPPLGPQLLPAITTMYPRTLIAVLPMFEPILSTVDGRNFAS